MQHVVVQPPADVVHAQDRGLVGEILLEEFDDVGCDRQRRNDAEHRRDRPYRMSGKCAGDIAARSLVPGSGRQRNSHGSAVFHLHSCAVCCGSDSRAAILRYPAPRAARRDDDRPEHAIQRRRQDFRPRSLISWTSKMALCASSANLIPSRCCDDLAVGPGCDRVALDQHAHDRQERSDAAGGGALTKIGAEDGNNDHSAIGIEESAGAPKMSGPLLLLARGSGPGDLASLIRDVNSCRRRPSFDRHGLLLRRNTLKDPCLEKNSL